MCRGSAARGKGCCDCSHGRGALRLLELQAEGKRRMSAHDFLLGVKLEPGEILGAAGGCGEET